jgi:kynurenine formamidase
MASKDLWTVLEHLQSQEFIDLTHAFQRGIPHALDMDDEVRTTLYHYDEGVGTKGHGFLAHLYSHVGQWGTHVDPPAHYIKGKRYVDDIPVQEMLLPLVLFDVADKVERNADYTLIPSDIEEWERKYGRIPDRAFAVLRTGWSSRWPSQTQMWNESGDSQAHFPGWSVEALKFLCEERDIVACGHETTDTDPGILVCKDQFPAETYLLSQDKFQIELLADLSRVPPHGSLAVVTFPKPYQGSGFPARVFAIVPRDT